MPVAIIAIILGSFLLFIKMILSHRQDNRTLPPVENGPSLLMSELEQMMDDRVNQAMEPLVSRIDELESIQLMAASEKILLGEGNESSDQPKAKSSIQS